jgi:archaellum component FlaC
MVTVAPGFRVVAATQLLLAIVVLGLAADRIAVWMAPERTPSLVTQAEAPWAASLPEVTKLERQLGELAQMQARTVDTIQSQHEGMAQLQSAITRLSSTQEKVVSNMLTVRQEMEKQQKGSGREVRQMTRLLMGKALSEQEQLEAEIHSLRVANDRLSQKMVGLEQDNEELKKKLKATGVEVSKAVVSGNGNATTTRPPDILQTPQSLQAADSRSNIQLQPFLFWVAFSEGVTQESIDQWLREMDGHKGVLNEGWQEVQIVQPAVPPDRFLDRIREAKIVKAVRTSR